VKSGDGAVNGRSVEQIPIPGTWTADDQAAVARYLGTVEPAIQGARGDDHTVAVGRKAKDLGCPDAATLLPLMNEHFNPRCSPPWELDQLAVKCKSAYHNAENRPGSASPNVAKYCFEVIEPAAPVTPPELPPGYHTIEADFDPTKIPLRPWVLGERLLRGAVTEIAGAPGTTKSMLALTSAIALVTRNEITHEPVWESGNVLVYDLEDSMDDLKSRVAGTCLHYKIPYTAIAQKIILRSGLEFPLVIANKGRDSVVPNKAAIDDLVKVIRAHNITAVFLTPMAGLQKGAEGNDNEAMDEVLGVLRDLAAKTGCAVVFAIHTTKEASKHKESVAGDMNIGRGASSIIGAVRAGYTLIRVSKKTLEDAGLPATTDMVRLTGGKGNYSAYGANDLYFRVIAVPIGSGTPESEFSNPNDPGFMNPNDRSHRPSDTVGVLEWFDMKAAERRAAGEKLVKQDSLVGVIAAAMPEVATMVRGSLSGCRQPLARQRQ
jgi:RecA/RadA recombinase